MEPSDSHYVAQSSDTDVAADRLQFEIYRSWSATEKLEAMTSLWRTARELSLAGLRLRHPRAPEEEIELREAALRLGDELARKVYGERYTKLPP
ncbi:MAG TPA: hypothetical protein VM509_06445 [Planctomycetota bacterium]|nr:hypothetical protein [Planctomycetota bacterium]